MCDEWLLNDAFEEQVLDEVVREVDVDLRSGVVERYHVRLHEVLDHVYQLLKACHRWACDLLFDELFEDIHYLLSFKGAQHLSFVFEISPVAQGSP